MPANRSAVRIIQNPAVVLSFLTLIGFILYSKSFSVPFIFDGRLILDEPSLLWTEITPAKMFGLTQVAIENTGSRLIANFTFALNYYFSQQNVEIYHIVNLVIHIITAFLVFLVAGQTLAQQRQSFASVPILTSLLWIAHPLQVQSVTYIWQRMNSLAALFYMLAFYLYIKARKKQFSEPSKKTVIVFLFSVSTLSGILAIGSKQTAITLPLMLILYEWFFFQDLETLWLKKRLMWSIIIIAALTGLVLVYLGESPWETIISTYTDKPFTPAQRLFTEFQVILYYLSLLVWPHPNGLALVYDFPLSSNLMTTPVMTLLALSALITLFVAAFMLAKQHRIAVFSLLWFLINLIPESSIIGLELLCSYRTYLPSVFPMMTMVLLIFKYIKSNRTALVVVCFFICFCGYWTIQRNRIWQNPVSLWQDNVRKSPGRSIAHNNLGLAYKDIGNLDKAILFLNNALRLKKIRYGDAHPQTAETYSNLGLCYDRQGDADQALHYHFKALKILKAVYGEQDLEISETYNNIGLSYDTSGDYDTAIAYYLKALRIELTIKHAASIYNNLGNAWYNKKEYDKAIANHKESLAIRTKFLGEKHQQVAESLNNLGLALTNKNDYDSAIDCFQQALTIEMELLGVNHPSTAATCLNLGMTYYTKKDFGKAGVFMRKIINLYTDILGPNHPYIKTAEFFLNESQRNSGDIYDK